MTTDPGKIRNIIYEACEQIEGCKLSDGFTSLMDYINLDLLVGWFVDEVCCGDISDCISENEDAESIQDWYDLHC